MLAGSGEDFTSRMSEKWAGKDITVSKTTSMTPINIKIEGARIAGWEEMDKRIQKKHSSDTSFLLINGQVGGESGHSRENARQFLVIPVDRDTVYDVRDGRMVVLTESEVVQFSLAKQ